MVLFSNKSIRHVVLIKSKCRVKFLNCVTTCSSKNRRIYFTQNGPLAVYIFKTLFLCLGSSGLFLKACTQLFFKPFKYWSVHILNEEKTAKPWFHLDFAGRVRRPLSSAPTSNLRTFYTCNPPPPPPFCCTCNLSPPLPNIYFVSWTRFLL